jgi:serine/threonine protein kinase
MKFLYNSGQRPLDGYTLKRGIGRGGFGEVYYAVSDGGKEVALKLVRGGNLEIELRGMAQCLNLKHPHLVSLYDLRTDPQGDHWVVMEYIAGEPLNVVLNRHPEGLPEELAQQWFLALAKAVGYLHDHGIVHRDLKPANIFIENGIVKVGDYGLSKFISSSQRTAQTQSVGTVHYMAPEISTGNYNRQIDIYAAGIILYEMLTGRVPFDGESAGEILMKHLTTPPDLSKLTGEYVTIVGRALAKNPAHRYASLAEMAKAVEAVGRAPQPALKPQASPASPPPIPKRPPARPEPIPTVLPVPSLRGQAAELCGSLALAAILAIVSTTLWTALAQGTVSRTDIYQEYFLTVATCWAVLVPAKFWNNRRGDSWGRRIIMMGIGVGVGLAAIWLDGWRMPPPLDGISEDLVPVVKIPWNLPFEVAHSNLAGDLAYFALAFFVLRWWKLADRRRAHRFSFAPILAAGFWGLVLLLVWQEPWRGTLVLTTSAAIIQLVSPWEQPPPPLARRMRLRCA